MGGIGCRYGYGEILHNMSYFPKAKSNMREGKQLDTSSVEGVPYEKARFFALKSKRNQK